MQGSTLIQRYVAGEVPCHLLTFKILFVSVQLLGQAALCEVFSIERILNLAMWRP